MATSLDGLFFTFYYKSLFSDASSVKLYGDGFTNGLSGLLPLELVIPISPTNYKNIKIKNRGFITLSWYPVKYADSYNVYKVEGTTSGFSDTPVFYTNTKEVSSFFIPTVTGISTYWVKWKICPVTQGYESSDADTNLFSYTRIS